jgi:hypothetical protein
MQVYTEPTPVQDFHPELYREVAELEAQIAFTPLLYADMNAEGRVIPAYMTFGNENVLRAVKEVFVATETQEDEHKFIIEDFDARLVRLGSTALSPEERVRQLTLDGEGARQTRIKITKTAQGDFRGQVRRDLVKAMETYDESAPKINDKDLRSDAEVKYADIILKNEGNTMSRLIDNDRLRQMDAQAATSQHQ